MSDKPRVVLHYLSFIHYRKSLFELLWSEKCPFEFNLLCDESSPYGVKSFSVDSRAKVMNLRFKRFIWQKGALRKTLRIKPDMVILLGVNPLILSSLFYFWLLKWRGIKVVWWGHGTLGHQGKFGVKMRMLHYKSSDGCIVYGNGGKEILESHGMSTEKIFVINNCINSEDYGLKRMNKADLIKARAFKKDTLNIIFSGRLTSAKKVAQLLKALSSLSKDQQSAISLKIIGDGPEKSTLEEQVSNYGLNSVVSFLGEVYGDDLEKHFLEADIFVHPGTIGLSVVQALSYGLPVITHNNFETQKPEAESLTHGYNSLLFEEDNVEGLLEKINQMKNMKPEEMADFQERCFESVARYTPEYVFEKFASSVINILGND
ncbi:MAG: glycosyltransferase involved in cell wall biosynthesis [Roseivirga sp.]|jgi:glycosyltransferase involved in cell wall biosynthesis